MNLKKTQIIIICFIITYFVNSHIYGEENSSNLRLTASISKRSFYIDEPLIVHTTLENITYRDLTVPSIGGIATNALSYKIEELFEDGKNYEVIIVTSENELAAEGWDIKVGTRLVKLPSGEYLYWKKDLFEVLKITKPGKYSLQAIYKDTEGIETLSEKIEFNLQKYDLTNDRSAKSIIEELNNTGLSKNTVSVIPAIYTYEDKNIISRLVELASNKVLDADTRFYAIVCLGKIKAIDAIPVLQQVVEDKNELDYFRSAACRSISNIQKSHKK